MLKKDELRIVFIGAGKIAYSLVPQLIYSDYKIIQIISRKLESAADLAEQNFILNYSNYIENIDETANLIFLSMNDSEIKQTADNIALQPFNFDEKIFLHLSGSLNINELSSLKEKGAKVGSLHIMQSFPNKDFTSVKNSFSAIEADDKNTFSLISRIANDLGMKSFAINSEQKTLYHLMGVFAANFLNANFYNSEIIAAELAIKNKNSTEILSPLIRKTIENIKNKGNVESLSGPIERGDISIIKKHIESLRDKKLILLNYLTISLTLLEIALEKESITQKEYNEIRSILVDELKISVKRID